MFERFTDRARKVVVLAQEEARILNHNYIGTEHILLGLISEGEGVAGRALEELGIGLEVVRQRVEEIVGRGKDAPSGHIPFTPRAKKVLEFSLRESNQLGHHYIGTEHILLGLIREGKGVAAQVLVSLGASLEGTREQVIELLHGYQGEGQEQVSPVHLPGSPRWLEELVSQRAEAVVSRLDAIHDRLTAIERHLGIAQEGPAEQGPVPAEQGPAQEGPAGEGPPGEGPPGEGPPGEGTPGVA